jgi:hypothetical protein
MAMRHVVPVGTPTYRYLSTVIPDDSTGVLVVLYKLDCERYRYQRSGGQAGQD